MSRMPDIERLLKIAGAHAAPDLSDTDLARLDDAEERADHPTVCQHTYPTHTHETSPLPGSTCGPHCAREIRRTAKADLDLLVSLVLASPEASRLLTRFVDQQADTEGALVFGAYLHLTGYSEAAAFWWQYAAGGGSATAAQALFLYHRLHGEHRTARHWRSEGRRNQPHRRVPVPAEVPRLPQVGQTLLAQCHRGASPHLPAAMQAAVNTWGRQHTADEADALAFPRPAPALPHALSCADQR